MPATNPVTKRFYPSLSSVMSVDDLPEFLHFAESGLEALLDRIHFKNLQFSKSYRGDAAFYSLDIVTKNIGFDLPFGLRFVLNPDAAGDSSISSFPVSLQYQWEILAFLRSVNLSGFAFTPDAFYQLGLQVFKITDEQVLANTLNFFVDPASPSVGKYDQLISDINTLYPAANLSIPSGQTPSVSLIAGLIRQNTHIPVSVSELMFAGYLLHTDLQTTKNNVQRFYNIAVPDGLEDYIEKLLKPKVRASLTLSAGLEFPLNILQPVTADGTVIPNTKSVFRFAEATFYVDTEAGIGSQLELGGSLTPTYAEIGKTGMIISFTNGKLDLSRTTNIPEATAAGYPVDFMGLYIQHASISFTKFGVPDTAHTSTTITADNLFIGTGGVSGTIGITAGSGALYRKFGNFGVKLDAFSITFRQNAIVSSSISGELTLPSNFNENGNPVTIFIDARIKDNGDFSITARPQAAFPVFTLPNVFTLSIRSLTVGQQGGRFFIAVAGSLDFIANIPGLGAILPRGVLINKLIIWDNGELEFEGGGLVVPQAFRLAVGPVKLEVSHLSLGSYTRKHNNIDRNYYYFGFDGMINTGNAGVEAAGNGIKYYFTHDNLPFDSFITIDSIRIDITVPGDASKDDAAFILDGYLSMKNPELPGSAAGIEYTGSVSFSMPRLGLAGSAGMRMQPDVPAFLVDIDMELSAPIPLGGTGLGIYGFRGLIGQHYLPSKTDDETWFQYYKRKSTITHQEGIEIDKFASKPGYSVGAGLTVATQFDSGFVFSSKLFLLLGMPDVFAIEGKAGILRKRLGLLDHADPPFELIVIFTPQSFEANFSVDYNLPDSSFRGDILQLTASLEIAFYFNNAGGWHLYIGRETPVEKQVSAQILRIFSGSAYLMISSQGIRAGAGIRFDAGREVWGFGFHIWAWFEMGGFISFRPAQIGGYIRAGGRIEVYVFSITLGLGLELAFGVEAPSPFNITGSIRITIRLWIFHKTFNLDLSWRLNDDNQTALPLPVLSLPDPARGYMPAAATCILSNEIFPINYVLTENRALIPPPGDPAWKYNFNVESGAENVLIPLDSFIDIELLKPVIPGNIPIGGSNSQLPGGYMEMIPPERGSSDQAMHQYEITGLQVYIWNGTAWAPYNIYEAVTAIVSSNTGPDAVDLSQLKQGYWQFTEKDRYNKIRLMSQNMFSYMNGTTYDYLFLNRLNFRPKDIFCYETVDKDNVVNWHAVTPGTSYQGSSTGVNIQLLNFNFSGIQASVRQPAGGTLPQLKLENGPGALAITFPAPVSHVQLTFGDNLNQVTVYFIKQVHLPGPFGNSFVQEQAVHTAQLSPGQQDAVIFDNLDNAIDKVLLYFHTPVIPDYDGDLIIGGHDPMPQSMVPPGLKNNLETDKALLFVAFYDRSFSETEVLAADYRGLSGTVAQWPMDSPLDSIGTLNGIKGGGPGLIPGFYEADSSGLRQSHPVYYFTANSDSLSIPHDTLLKVENGSFAFDASILFDPFTAGISTLFSKVVTDPAFGYRKGYTLHLIQPTPASRTGTYQAVGQLPHFSLQLTCYSGLSATALTVTEAYTTDCATGKAVPGQTKRVFVSVDRETGMISMYIDKILKTHTEIPAELAAYSPPALSTWLDQISYVTQVQQRRKTDNQVTQSGFINEIKILSDTLNKTVQPIWRPDSTYAITVSTQDRVNGSVPSGGAKKHIFGFKTAGPLGHFHQRSKIYQDLAKQDRAAAFKLAGLRSYIDMERSFPDAQGRYDLSKPVLYHDPQVRLIFNRPYMNAMFSNWAVYQGLPAIQSSLQLRLLDPSGNIITQNLTWEPAYVETVDTSNLNSLSMDEQVLYMFNAAASQGTCDPMPAPVLKLIRPATFHFPDLLPNRLYTALFSASYQAGVTTYDDVEVYRFPFMTSRYADFAGQASSFVLSDVPGEERYALYSRRTAFRQDDIDNVLQLLINNDPADDPAAVLHYAGKYERIVYGGLKFAAPETSAHSVIQLVFNTDPDTDARKLLGILVYNPEPFNDPKLPAEALAGTIALRLTRPDHTVVTAAGFINSYSRDNSAVFITNAAMDIPAGKIALYFRYKMFNGVDYETSYADYQGPDIDIAPYFS
jgi:hypothetical protein